MTRTSTKRVAFAAICGFVASSLWWVSVPFGNQCPETREPSVVSTEAHIERAAEVFRNLLLASGFTGM